MKLSRVIVHYNGALKGCLLFPLSFKERSDSLMVTYNCSHNRKVALVHLKLCTANHVSYKLQVLPSRQRLVSFSIINVTILYEINWRIWEAYFKAA